MAENFANSFVEGFEDAAPDNYDYAEDCTTPNPWCAPWLNGVELREWFDADKTAYDMGAAYAEAVYDEVEQAFQKKSGGKFNAESMGRFLGPDATDADAEKFASFLEENGWVLIENSEGQFEAYKGGRKMSESEWQNALRACFA